MSVTCRSNYEAVKQNGLQLKTHSYGDYHFQPHAVFPSIEAAARSGTQFDYIVVTTKALPDVTDDSLTIAPLVSSSSSVVLIQNGVGVEDPHRSRFPNSPILSAVTIVSAEQTEPGVVRQNKWTRISVGPYVRGPDDAREGDAELTRRSAASNKRFVELLQLGGIADAEEYDEKGLQLVRWHKLAVSRLFAMSTAVPANICQPSTDQLEHEPQCGPLGRDWERAHGPRRRASHPPPRMHGRALLDRAESPGTGLAT